MYFKHLGKTDGLSQISVISICQDELGRMWFGTLEGLSCYDGNSMTVYKPSQDSVRSFLGNNVDNLVSDKQGNLFFISDYALVRYDLRKEQFSLLKQRATVCMCITKRCGRQHVILFSNGIGRKRNLLLSINCQSRNISPIFMWTIMNVCGWGLPTDFIGWITWIIRLRFVLFPKSMSFHFIEIRRGKCGWLRSGKECTP